MKCIVCGAEIKGKYASNRKYCSLKCKRKGAVSLNMDNIAKKASSHNKIRFVVQNRYNQSCAICGWQASEQSTINGKIWYGRGNEIHHIIPISENGTNNANNVILLCPNHHKQADLGIISREQLRNYTKPYILTEEQAQAKTLIARKSCAEAISKAIFE